MVKIKKRTPDAIPDILTDALAVSFDNSVGHDYLLDGQERYDYLSQKRREDTFRFRIF